MLRYTLILILSLTLVGSGEGSFVQRPTKTCGSRNYVEETSLGCITILNNEVDADLDTIIDDYNGNIDASNLADNAVGTTEIQSGAVTGAKLASDSVTTVKIVNLAVTTAKLADLSVTGAKIFPNATAGQNVVVSNVPPSVLLSGTVEITLFDTAHFTSRGVTTLLFGSMALECLANGTTEVNTLNVRLYRCTVAFGCGFVQQQNLRCAFTAAGMPSVYPVVVPFSVAEVLGGGADSFYRVTIQQSTATGPSWATSAFPGVTYIQELR